MCRTLLLIYLCLLGHVATEQLRAPGDVNCPSLQIGHRVIADHSCSSGSSVPGTVCSFGCNKGFKLSGPPLKHCKIDGTWTDAALPVSCDDVNECDVQNGFCSHICKNTEGSYHCDCPPPFFLDPADQRRCKAHGVQLTCKPNHMEIVLPKNLIHNLAHEHLSLLDPACRASGNATHYSLSTAVTECGTQSHVYKNFIVYTNRVLESPNEDFDVITHVGKNEIKVPFSCYFNNLEIVHAVGFKPVAQKIHVYVKGRGNYELSLDIFKDKSYGEGGARALVSASPKYTQADFPVSVHLRERVYVQASLDTREKDLKVFASNCCSTPMQDHEATMKFRHPLIVEGCPRDPSVQFHHSSDPTKVRFSFEAFQFLGDHDYVFVHCRVHVCDVNDSNSRCAKGCINGNGPAVQDQGKKPVAQPNKKRVKKVKASEKGLKKPEAVKQQEADSKPEKPVHDAKTSKLHAAAKKLVGKSVIQPKAKKSAMARVHHIMKRAIQGSHKRGVLGSADVSKGPFIFENVKRERKPGKVFAHAKRNEVNRDVKNAKRSSAAPSASNILLVALTVASILALLGVAYLGRKAMKTVNNPYNYEPLVVN